MNFKNAMYKLKNATVKVAPYAGLFAIGAISGYLYGRDGLRINSVVSDKVYDVKQDVGWNRSTEKEPLIIEPDDYDGSLHGWGESEYRYAARLLTRRNPGNINRIIIKAPYTVEYYATDAD